MLKGACLILNIECTGDWIFAWVTQGLLSRNFKYLIYHLIWVKKSFAITILVYFQKEHPQLKSLISTLNTGLSVKKKVELF